MKTSKCYGVGGKTNTINVFDGHDHCYRCLMGIISEINILSEQCTAAKPAIVNLDKVRSSENTIDTD